MKTITIFLIVCCCMARSLADDHTSVLILTSKDVETNSVRVATKPNLPVQNLVFRLLNKTPNEIKVIQAARLKIVVMKTNAVILETSSFGLLRGRDKNGETNWVGLVLIIGKYNQAKAAESALRGN